MQPDGDETRVSATGMPVTGSQGARSVSGGDGRPRVWLASELIGTPVLGATGERIGKLDDIVVHPGANPAYAVLSIGGWLGMGDRLYATPFKVLQIGPDEPRSLGLTMNKGQMIEAPGFEQNAWPNFGDAAWTEDVERFYTGRVADDVAATTRLEQVSDVSFLSLRVTDLDGHAVKDQRGEKLGDIKEIAIDASGRARYAVLSVGGFLGIGDKQIAVPWQAFSFSSPPDGGEKIITLSTTKEQLTGAPPYKHGAEHTAEMRDEGWIARLGHYFERR